MLFSSLALLLSVSSFQFPVGSTPISLPQQNTNLIGSSKIACFDFTSLLYSVNDGDGDSGSFKYTSYNSATDFYTSHLHFFYEYNRLTDVFTLNCFDEIDTMTNFSCWAVSTDGDNFYQSNTLYMYYTEHTGFSFNFNLDGVHLDEWNLYFYIDYLDLDFFLDTYADTGSTQYTTGYNDGYNDGYNTGHQSGYDEGYNTGLSEGSDTGYSTGYTTGYTTGYNVALSTHDFSFTNLFASIGDTPILMIRRLFGFELFGTSLIAVFMSLFTALIIIHVIKKVF